MDFKPSTLQLPHYDPYPKGNLYSLYCIKPSDFLDTDKFTRDSKVNAFLFSCIVHIKYREFINKLTSEVKLNRSFMAKSVEYYDNQNINGQINLFQKVQEYMY